ncbi:MAG: tRNA dihydrouridine synthase DusB [Clostridiales bacterium]|nr:tRNA dihydrouridine synthase DusB [Clostridiales bacterium]
MKSVRIGEIVLKNPVVLSPMAGISSLPFRIICNEMGAAYSPTELVSARSIRYNGVDKSFRYMRISPEEEGITAIQLFGSEPEDFEAAVDTILNTQVLKDVSIIDINMGCPVPKVVKTGSGSALMEDPARAADIVRACKKAVEGLPRKIPVTVKTRTGFNAGDNGKPDFAKALADAGCDMICVHGRNRPQMYHGESSSEAIALMREAVRGYDIPFFANGDITDADSAARIIEQTGCDGIMIGRAARGNPWIFEQVTAGLAGTDIPKYPDSLARKQMLIRELEGRIKYLPEDVAVREFRSVMPYYIKGIPGAAAIKVRLVSAVSFDEVKEIIDLV